MYEKATSMNDQIPGTISSDMLCQKTCEKEISPELFTPGQIRLAELSVFNWGPFNALHTVRIDPLGTLITGDNGSGKTTLIDGLMALLLPAGKASFNVAAAQGDKTDRSLLSYMRGSYGSAHDGSGTRVKSIREKAVVSGIRALYRADDGTMVTLAALFWTTQSTNALSDVKRIYVVSRRDMALKEMLDNFGPGGARSLKQWLRSDPDSICCDDNFSEYQTHYRKLLNMENKNAPALLSRALGLKKIDDLTRLIRELVLEPSTVKYDARKVVEEFGDLVAIHEQLADARAQARQLEPLPRLDEEIRNTSAALEVLGREKDSLPAFLGKIYVQLWQNQISEIRAQIDAFSEQIQNAKDLKQEASQRADRWREKYLRLGGDKIETIKKDLQYAHSELERVIKTASCYQTEAKELNLSPNLDEKLFVENQSKADNAIAGLTSRINETMDQFGGTSGQYSLRQQELHALDDEIREMEARPDSNIPVKYQQLRDELSQALSLEKEKLMFIGELIDLKEDERTWQGAVERALGGLRTTLAVPHEVYSMVTRWINARHTGLHVRVQVVPGAKTETFRKPAAFKDNGYLRKLVWREHPYRDWLKKHLEKFDLHCVSDTAQLDQTPFSMTCQGLVHLTPGRFEKKDQYKIEDRRQWCLGFSNTSRLAVLKADSQKLSRQMALIEKELIGIKEKIEQTQKNKGLWEKLKNYAWQAIDVPSQERVCKNLTRELDQLTRAGSDLEKAKALHEKARDEIDKIQSDLDTLHADNGRIENQLETAQGHYESAKSDAEAVIDDLIKKRLEKRVGDVSMADLERKSQIYQQTRERLDADLKRQDGKRGLQRKPPLVSCRPSGPMKNGMS